jgi:hypothetical protein
MGGQLLQHHKQQQQDQLFVVATDKVTGMITSSSDAGVCDVF